MIGTINRIRQNHLKDSILSKHPNFFFWFIFSIINSLIFLPTFLLNLESSTFLPKPILGEQGILETVPELLVWRNNLDLFRVSAEFIFLISLWVFLPIHKNRWLKKILLILTTVLFFLAFAYEVYESLSLFFYQVDAVFYAHYQLFIDGLGFLVDHLQISWLRIFIYIVAILAWFGMVSTLIRILIQLPSIGLNTWSKTILIILLAFVLQALMFNRNLMVSPKSVVHSFSMKAKNNLTNSIALSKKVDALETFQLENSYDYDAHTLIKSPNIYLIFVESYGSILYKRDAFLDKYLSLLQEKEGQLTTSGWYVSSTLSESPTWGGGSWLAYTSLLFGFRVDNHPQYLSMLENYQAKEKSDFGSTMQKLGYQYIRSTSLAVEMDDQEWKKYVDFFGVDKWIRYRDLQYEGKHYGWGPSPPDQFTLSATRDMIIKESGQPFFLFLITQNSHYPWTKVPQVVQDWRTLNDGNAVVDIFEDDDLSRGEKQENYFEAISYEIEFLTNFIINEAETDDIFILIGDHQPGYVTRRDDGFETPVHVISKDKDFIRAFTEYGFDSGLEVHEIEAAIKHEGFYSLFMQIFLQHYGVGINVISPYLPNGVQLDLE